MAKNMHSLKTAVLVSYGCCNKPWLKITLKIMLEAKAQISIIVPKSRCQQGHTFSLGSGKICSLLLLTSGRRDFPWLVATSLQSLPLRSHGLLFSLSNLSLSLSLFKDI